MHVSWWLHQVLQRSNGPNSWGASVSFDQAEAVAMITARSAGDCVCSTCAPARTHTRLQSLIACEKQRIVLHCAYLRGRLTRAMVHIRMLSCAKGFMNTHCTLVWVLATRLGDLEIGLQQRLGPQNDRDAQAKADWTGYVQTRDGACLPVSLRPQPADRVASSA